MEGQVDAQAEGQAEGIGAFYLNYLHGLISSWI